MPTRYTEITAGGRCYRLDRQAQAVYREKAELHRLTPQQLQLLELFISQPRDALITQEQLREHLYGKSPVTPEAVPVAVKSLRKALGPGFLRTEHGRGYRLVAEITHFDEVERQTEGEVGVRARLRELANIANEVGDQIDAQEAWASEVRLLLDSLLGPSPLHMVHSDAYFEITFAKSHAAKVAILRAVLLSLS